ncbi:uncharacterized protein J3R85_016432 [Psidium guajava]|nr:uncharacterized protein J3R85_016432 [Psidium guajava]
MRDTERGEGFDVEQFKTTVLERRAKLLCAQVGVAWNTPSGNNY